MISVSIGEPILQNINKTFSKHIENNKIKEKFNIICDIIKNNDFDNLYLFDNYAIESIDAIIKLIDMVDLFKSVIIYTQKLQPNSEEYLKNLKKEDSDKLKNILIYHFKVKKKEETSLEMHARYLVFMKNNTFRNVFLLDNSLNSLNSPKKTLDVCEQTDIYNVTNTINLIISSPKNKIIFKGGKYVKK